MLKYSFRARFHQISSGSWTTFITLLLVNQPVFPSVFNAQQPAEYDLLFVPAGNQFLFGCNAPNVPELGRQGRTDGCHVDEIGVVVVVVVWSQWTSSATQEIST